MVNNKDRLLYFGENLRYDIPAGFVSFLVALPLCLGIALASGAPLFSGIIAGVVGGVVVTLISGSQISISGPAAGLTVIVFSGIAALKSFETFLLAVFLAGFMQIIFGLLKGGIIGYFFPSSVVKGMLTAIGFLLVLKQFPHALGYDHEVFENTNFASPTAGTGENTFTIILHAFNEFHFGALVISTISFAIMIGWDQFVGKKLKWFGGPLIAVIVSCLINEIFWDYLPEFYLSKEHLVSIPRTSLFSFVSADFNLIFSRPVIYTAFTIAVVASLESLITIEALDQIDPLKRQTPRNRELIAQGAGNIISGLLGGLPITAVVVRSTTNMNAGGKTKLSPVIHSLLLGLAVVFFSKWVNMIPLASLSAILLIVGVKLANPLRFKHMYNEGLPTFLPFMVTIVAIVFHDLLWGIVIGSLVGLYYVVRTNFHSAIGVSNEPDQVTIHLKKDVSYLNKAQLIRTLNKIPRNKAIVIDGSKAEFIDKDIAEVLNNFKTHSDLSQRKVEIKNTKYKTDSDENAYHRLLEGNREFVKERVDFDPEYFRRMAKGQNPNFLWIGCSDSRVPANEITKTDPGDMFVHRNIANLVVKTDFNLMSVLQYAVQVLKVKHIIVCGHYECGGVKAAMGNQKLGLIDNWLGNIKDVYAKNQQELESITDQQEKTNRMVELSVAEQVANLSKMSTVQEAWKHSKFPIIHGWVYDIENGELKDLGVNMEGNSVIPEIYRFEV
jgi:carbonic anhydrase